MSLCLLGAAPVLAQTVNTDGTVGTAVVPDGSGGLMVTGGTQRLTTLFHSFSDFSPGGTDILFLLNPGQSTVDTVIGRVTGDNTSFVDGQLALFGGNSPDLFLINPNGITFGNNASLALPGSFLASSANAVAFTNDAEFSAVGPSAAPLLTISRPVGLTMGDNPGDIHVNNSGHTIALTGFSPLNLSTTPPGLAIRPGQSLTLVGGNLALEGGRLWASSGHLNLAALASGQFSLQADGSGYHVVPSSVVELGDIRLGSAALLDVSGLGAGRITLQADNIHIGDGSVVVEQNFGALPGGTLRLFADNQLTVDGGFGALPSQVVTQNFGPGVGGHLDVNAGDIDVTRGGFLGTNSYGPAPAGDVQVISRGGIQLAGAAVAAPTQLSTIGSLIFSSGDAAAVTVDAATILISDSASITSLTAAAGRGGDLSVTATESITLIGESPFAKSSIDTVAFGEGDAGSVSVTTPRLSIRDGAGVLASTHGPGNGGDIVLNISDLLEVQGIPGEGPERNPTLVGASAVSLADTALGRLVGLPQIVAGDSGNVTINAANVVVSDRGSLSVSVIDNGLGNTGDLTVNADILKFERQGNISALTFSGDGGNVYLNLDTLLSLQERGQIDVRSLSNGNGGNISIISPIILGVDNSDIIANAVTGNGGNIEIATQVLLGLAFRDQRTSNSDITASSQFGLNGVVEINDFEENVDSGLVQLSTDLENPDTQITQGCDTGAQEFVMTGRGGTPTTPIDLLSTDNVWVDVRDLDTVLSTEMSEPARAVLVSASLAGSSLSEATAWDINTDGDIELVALDADLMRLQDSATCSAS